MAANDSCWLCPRFLIFFVVRRGGMMETDAVHGYCIYVCIKCGMKMFRSLMLYHSPGVLHILSEFIF